MGIAAGQRVNRSVIVKRFVKPLDGGSVTMSTCMWEKRRLGTSNRPIGGTTFLRTLALWQFVHCLAQLATSAFMFGHTNLAATACTVRWTPGCPRQCIVSNMRFLHARGTNGRAGPLLTSTMMLWSPMSTFLKFKPVLASREIL